MRVVLQRVKEAWVSVEGGPRRQIGPGLLLLFGAKKGDTMDVIPKLAKKCAQMRIWEDEAGKLNISSQALGLSALIVSNFTLFADTASGNRPSFFDAAEPAFALPAYNAFVDEMKKQGLKEIQTGEFGANMQVGLVNDGPITIVVDTDEWKKG